MGKTTTSKKTVIKYWPIIAIIGLWLIFSVPYFFKGLVPFPSKYLVTFFPPWSATYGMPVKNNAMPDLITQIYPWKTLTVNEWKNGEIPLWNPYSFSGTVHAGNYQTAVFSPINIFYLFLNFLDAWSIIILLQPLLAGIFCYIFLRSIDRSKAASLIGSVGWMFCGFLTTWMGYGTLGYAALFLPLILMAIYKEGNHSSWKNGILISGGIFLSFVSGHFQISLYVLLLSFAFILYRMISLKTIKIHCRVFGYWFFGILLVFPQFILTYKAFMESTRSTSIISGEMIPWNYLITFFAPDFFGNPVTRNDWFGHYAEWAGFSGVAVLILAVYSITKNIRGLKRFFLFALLTSILMAYHSPVSQLIFFLKIPVLSTSAASRIIILVSMSLSVLAAFGFDDLNKDWEKRLKNKIPWFAGGVISFVSIIWSLCVVFHVMSPEAVIIAKRNLILPSLYAFIVLFSMVIGFSKNHTIRNIAISALLLVGFIDPFRYVSKWMPFEPREYVYPNSGVTDYLSANVGNNRVFGNLGNEVGSTYKIQLIDGYDAMYQGRYGEFINSVTDGKIEPGERSVVQVNKNGDFTDTVFSLLGVKYIAYRISDGRNPWVYPHWKHSDTQILRFRDSSYEVYENTESYPRVFLASSYRVVPDDQSIIRSMFSGEVNLKDTIILEKKPILEPQIGSGSAQIISYTPNEVVIKTQSDVPKLLFLSDVYDTGWNATIDGKKAPIQRADYDFRAIAVSAGSHEIKLRYLPVGFLFGCIISAISCIGIFILSKKHI
jgi:hypothetical protein